MGKRRFKYTQRKNEERKRYRRKSRESALKVSIPLACGISVHRDLDPLPVSIPLSVVHLSSVSSLRFRLNAVGALPTGWLDVSEQTPLHANLRLCKFQLAHDRPEITLSLTVHEDFSWKLLYRDRVLEPSTSSVLKDIPLALTSVSAVVDLLETLDGCQICVGNPDIPTTRTVFLDATGTKSTAYVDTATFPYPTIRHSCCNILLSADLQNRCLNCVKHRATLRKMVQRDKQRQSDELASPESHGNYRYLRDGEKDSRLHNTHSLYRNTKSKLDRLRVKIAQVTSDSGVQLDEETHADMVSMMAESSKEVEKTHSEDSFQRIFWEEQRKAVACGNPRQVRWHPLIIKWCLYLRHRSSGAYETIRKSGVLKLPSQRTLRDYTHYIPSKVGFSAEVDRELLRVADYRGLEEWQKYVAVIMDEMHLKEDLVYNKVTGALMGFTSVGDINDHLLKFQESLESPSTEKPPTLANSMMVFMVRGLFTYLQFPYAQFACRDLSGDLLFDPFWEAVMRLERCGFKVLAATFDGASVNRRLLKIHGLGSSDLLHKVLNPFASEERYLYFFSDPPHLMKTVRNCWASKSRHLWCDGKEIRWSHLAALYFRDAGAQREAAGLALIPKLKYEHIHLTSFSKMRVDLAAQVLSESVSKALVMTGGPDAAETAKFVGMFDKFFDCLNVTSFDAGKKKRKPFLDPYRSSSDFRLKWLEEEFLQYLDNWEKSVNQRKELSKTEKKLLLLSSETQLGLRITVKSFVELVRFLFTIPGVKVFLSERLSQDPLEKFFGCQRQRGRVNENPCVTDFCHNTQALRVINSFCLDPVKGNCRGKKSRPVDLSKENTPLPKRPRPKYRLPLPHSPNV